MKSGLRYIMLTALFTAAVILFAFTASDCFGATVPSGSARVTESDGVNIRSSYTTSASIAGGAPYQAILTVNGEHFTKVSTASDTVWYKVTSGYGTGYVRSDLVSLSHNLAGGKTATTVNLRTGPSKSFQSVGALSKGTSVKVALSATGPDGNRWLKLYHSSSYYYVPEDSVNIESGTVTPAPGGTTGKPLTDSEFESMMKREGFPDSYRPYLRQLHKKHPSWRFSAKHLGFSWKDALAAQLANVNANTIASSFPDSYKAVKEGTYNFETGTYLSKDGPGWVAASEQAVAYYMDPRNWLEEEAVFMFEPNSYKPSYQTESLVGSILYSTALPKGAVKYYMNAAQQTYNGTSYSISPVYLASKTRIELGSSDFMINGHAFTYGGKSYKNAYNAYNIGAVDSADGSAALKGLVYAAGGSDGSGTSFLRPWNTLEKAVKGGALYIAGEFLAENQYTGYSERYNVYNGLSAIGTHQYATSIFTAATQASIVYSDYRDFDVLDSGFEFEIPVYTGMPAKAAARPPEKGNNNSYLDGIIVSVGGKKLEFTKKFDRFSDTYTVKKIVGKNTDSLTVKAQPNAADATVTVTGNQLKNGKNKITIRVKSSSGLSTKNYTVNVTKDNSIIDSKPDEKPVDPDTDHLISGVESTELNADAIPGEDHIRVSWKKSSGFRMDYYEVFRSSEKGVYGNRPYFTTKDGMKTSYKNTGGLKDGVRYYYKVRGVRSLNGTLYYSRWSNEVSGIFTVQPSPPSESDRIAEGVKNTEVVVKSVQGDGYIRLEWVKSLGFKVDWYEVFRSEDRNLFGEEPYFRTSDGTKLSYKNTKGLKKGTRYYYKVRGVRNVDGRICYTKWSNLAYRTYAGGTSGEPSPSDKLADGVRQTTITCKSELGSGYIRLNWEKSPGYKMDFYEIFRSEDRDRFGEEPYFRTSDGTKLSYKNTKGLKKGTRYYYKVRGVRNVDGRTYYSQWSNIAYRLVR